MPAVNFERLRDRRDELGLTNARLAELVGKSQGYVENILYGTDEPSRQVMYRLRDALNLPMSEIEADKRDEPPQGDPSEPPVQPPTGPSGPPKRRNGARDERGPRRAVA